MTTCTTTPAGTLSWKEVCNDPNLHDLPYKIETNDRGQIVMSPTYAWHGRYAFWIAQQLERHLPKGGLRWKRHPNRERHEGGRCHLVHGRTVGGG